MQVAEGYIGWCWSSSPPLGWKLVVFHYMMLALKWVPAHSYDWTVHHLSSCFYWKPVGLLILNIHHQKPVLRHSRCFPSLFSQVLLSFMQQKHGRHWYREMNIFFQCWCSYPMVWYVFAFLDTGIGCSAFPWCHTMYHQVSGGCWSPVGTTDVSIAIRLGIRVHSWCCRWLCNVSYHIRLQYSTWQFLHPLTFIIPPYPLNTLLYEYKLPYVVIDFIFHSGVGMVVKPNEEGVGVYLELFWVVSYIIFFIFLGGYVFLGNIDTKFFVFTPNYWYLDFLLSYMVSWTVPAIYIACFSCLYALKGFSDLFLDFIHFLIMIFAFFIHIFALIFSQILSTPLISISIVIFF